MAENTIDPFEYKEEIASLVEEAKRELMEYGRDDADPLGYVQDRLHEAIDGHRWVIYTHFNPQVLFLSDNADALFDVTDLSGVTNYSDALMQLAYYAMLQDALDEVNPDELEEMIAGGAEEEDLENAATMTPSGHLGSRISATFDGKFIGEFRDEDAAMVALRREARKHNYWPALYFIDDHGGVNERSW